MLKRQKVILALLQSLSQPVSPTKLVKMVFLLKQETALRGESTFYDFVPYKYGPFSFAFYRELSALQQSGYLSMDDRKIALTTGAGMKEHTKQQIEELPAYFRSSVEDITRGYGRTPQRSLLRLVYEKYPWYASRTELREFVVQTVSYRKVAPVEIYTVGYEGKSVDAFFGHLIQAGIMAVLDVRANPVSRKYGFARKSISEIAHKLGFEYHHFPKLGISSADRTDLSDYQSYQRLLSRYEAKMLPNKNDEIARIAKYVQRTPSALLCMEKDARWCHRGRLAKAISKINNLPVRHL